MRTPYRSPILLVAALLLSGCFHASPQQILTRLQAVPTGDVRLDSEGRDADRDPEDGCGNFACLCEGQKQCGAMITSGKCKNGTIDCIFDPPAICLCELKTTIGPIITSGGGDSPDSE